MIDHFCFVDIAPEMVVEHRLYDYEVLEFSPTVSMLVLLPPRSQVCCMSLSDSNTDSSSKPSDLIGIPLKTFELSHLHTYQLDFIKAYTRAMVLIDMECTAALQAQREVSCDVYEFSFYRQIKLFSLCIFVQDQLLLLIGV